MAAVPAERLRAAVQDLASVGIGDNLFIPIILVVDRTALLHPLSCFPVEIVPAQAFAKGFPGCILVFHFHAVVNSDRIRDGYAQSACR